MNLWNVFDGEMVLQGVVFAADAAQAVSIVSGWHGTGRTEGWAACVATQPGSLIVNPRAN